MISAIKYPEIVEKVDLFQKPSFKTDGFSYGPNCSLEDTLKSISLPTYEMTNYGPSELESPYIHIKDPTEIKIALHERLEAKRLAYWRFQCVWYSRVWKYQEKREEEDPNYDPTEDKSYL